MVVLIRRLTPEIVDDFLYFFDHIAFTDNPDWASCYCYYYHIACDDQEWMSRTAEENRSGAIQLVLSQKMHGYLAYVDNQPVGWCNAGRKAGYPRLLSQKELWDSADERVVSIVCFIIAPSYRRKGIGKRLLEEVCSVSRDEGCEFIEAYPRKGKLSDAQLYHGPYSMYMNKGFTLYKDYQAWAIVRKRLLPK